MFPNYFSCLNFSMYLLSIMLGISSNSFFSLWLAMEVNLLTYIYILLNSNILENKSLSMKYFVIQAFFSMIMLVMFIFMSMFFFSTYSFMMKIVLLSKLGSVPFHLWFLIIMLKLEWNKLFLLISTQKILPLFGLSNFNSNMLMVFIILNTIIALINSFGQMIIKILLAYSSIFNLAWMLALVMNLKLLLLFFMTYILSVWPIIQMSYKFMIYNLMEVMKKMSFFFNEMIFFLSFLSMSGIPPLIGFWGKLLAMTEIMVQNNKILIFFLLISSVFILYFYLRVCVFGLSLMKLTLSFTFSQHQSYSFITFIIIIMSILLMLYMFKCIAQEFLMF